MIRFIDRHDAAQKLIPLISKYSNEPTVILAVPRGGVPLGYYIAKKYNFPLDLLMTKKIGHPMNPEYAIGAVGLEDYIVDKLYDVPASYIEEQVEKIRKSLKERYQHFMGNQSPQDIHNKNIIIVDDGIATGNTILSSIKMLRQHRPKKIIVAVPVAPPEAIEKIKKQVDEIICLHTPDPLVGVGLYYWDFRQVSDEEVVKFLNDANQLIMHHNFHKD